MNVWDERGHESEMEELYRTIIAKDKVTRMNWMK